MQDQFTDLQKQAIAISARGTRLPDQTGADTNSDMEAINRSKDMDTSELISRGFRSFNAAAGVVQWADRAFTAPDPNFKLNDVYPELTDGIPEQYKRNFNSIRSMEEGQKLRADIMREIEDQQVLALAGSRGYVGMGLASILDVDAPLMFLSGGSYLGTKAAGVAAKVGLSGTRLGSAVVMGATGLEASTLVQTVSTMARPTGEWTDIPDAALGGLVFGSVLGAALPHSAQLATEQVKQMRQSFEEGKARGFPDPVVRPVRKDPTLGVEPVEGAPAFQSDSLGAASVRPTVTYGRGNTSKMVDRMTELNRADGYTGTNWEVDSYFKDNPVSKLAKAMYKGAGKVGLASDFDKLFNAPGVIAPSIANRLFESPTGVGRMNNATAANLMEGYTIAIQGPVGREFRPAFKQWLAERKNTTPTELAWNDTSLRSAFARELQIEQAYRYHDGGSNPASPASIRKLADAFDEGAENSISVLKGQDGETPVFGSENLKPRKGWSRQVWYGRGIQDAITRIQTEFRIKDGKKHIINTLSSHYQQLHGWDKEVTDAIASAVIARALSHAEGANTSLFRTMSFEDGNYLKEMLLGNNFDPKTVDKFMEHIKGKQDERGKMSALKDRVDIDPRAPIPGTDMTLMDLLDPDIEATWMRYAQTASGTAGLARNGINFHELDDWFLAMNDEITAHGGQAFSPEFLQTMRSYFSGNPVGGGVNPLVRRLNGITRLSLLNQMALPQLGEFGNTIGMMHLDNVLAVLPSSVKAIFNGKLMPVHEEVQYMMNSVIGEHLVTLPHRSLDEIKFDAVGAPGQLGQLLDTAIAKGQRIQGYVSGFYKINQLMQDVAMRSFWHRMYKHANGVAGNNFDPARWADIGLDAVTRERVLQGFRDHVTFKDGQVTNLNPDKWNSADFNALMAVSRRVTNQAVQKSFAGESAWWMHQTAGSFFMALKGYTFNALNKQLIRNMRVADPEASMMFFWGLGSAAAAYTAREYINGRGEKMDSQKLMRGILNYSSMTAPAVSFLDPAMTIMGLGDYQVGNYGGGGRYGTDTSLLSMPVQFTVANRLWGIPSALVHGVTGDLNKNDVYALTATPLVGNMYGMGLLAQSIREDIDMKKRAKKEAARKEQEK